MIRWSESVIPPSFFFDSSPTHFDSFSDCRENERTSEDALSEIAGDTEHRVQLSRGNKPCSLAMVPRST